MIRKRDFLGSTIKLVGAVLFITWANLLLPYATTTATSAFALGITYNTVGLVLCVEALAGIVDTSIKRE